ncbi:MAG: STAS-like domain-containing protein [Treponema sp.]|nr:STAS-like domain-containing protein [Treponema sp.]
MKISVLKDFSKTPGFRLISDGPFSGEEFRNKLLEPLFNDTSKSEKIQIDLDNVSGYATSFLEEAFGGLARKYGVELVLDRISFISNDEPLLIEEITTYIRNAQ